MAKDALDGVRQNIRERLEQLESERDQLMRALEALSTPASPLRRRGRPPGTGSAPAGGAAQKRTGGKRAARGQRREQVLAVLEGRELGPSGIAREIGDVNPTQISGLLRQLASEGRVARTEGGRWRLASGGGQPAPTDAGAAANGQAATPLPPTADA